MAKNLVHYTCYLIVLTSCVDQGHGRWKRRDKENLQHDIDTFKKMAEKIEREIEAFYEDYSDEKIKEDDIENIHQQYKQFDHKTDTKNIVQNPKNTEENFHFASTANITNEIQQLKAESHQSDATESNIHVSFRTDIHESTKDSKTFSTNWPKFDDILLAIGKRYDWKNDRWIKVKKKLKESRLKRIKEDSSSNFYEKHKFIYRTIKLNRSKSRRNVVIAVSAIR